MPDARVRAERPLLLLSTAKVELEHGDNEEVKATAQKVIDDQAKEVERLNERVDKEVKE